MNKKIVVASIVVLGVLASIVFWGGVHDQNQELGVTTEVAERFTAISPTLFEEKLASGIYTVVDVRTPEEIADGKVSSTALELDFYAPDFVDQLQALDRTTPYLVYCRSSNRSSQVLSQMKALGFVEVYELAGGINAWQAAGYPLVQ